MHALVYSLIPALFALTGGFLATLYTPSLRLISVLQHFVAGVVIGAVAVELLPKISTVDSPFPVAVGFLIGIGFMVFLHELSHRLGSHTGRKKLPLRMIGGSAIDLFVDGILIGLSFLAGAKSGLLIALSLTPCAFFLSLTLSSTLRKRELGKFSHLLFILSIACMLPLGALIGSTVVATLSASFVIEAISASIAALLYLGIEEFLVEAHKTKDTHFTPLAFFLGFLIVLLFRF